MKTFSKNYHGLLFYFDIVENPLGEQEVVYKLQEQSQIGQSRFRNGVKYGTLKITEIRTKNDIKLKVILWSATRSTGDFAHINST